MVPVRAAAMRLSLLASTAVMATGAGTVAQAADANAPAAVTGEVIVVTAQKRSENLQQVPISIEALSAAKLSNNQVQSFDDYAKLLPSVSFQSFGPGQSQIYFRGVSSGADANGSHSGPQPTSALYVDDIPLTTIGGAPDLHVYDIERVEALSGPQGTLFGASSLSGTLRLITTKPKLDKTEGGVDLTATTYGRGSNSSGGTLEGFFNLPLAHNVALRVSAFYERDGGYISNVSDQPTGRTYQVYNATHSLVPLTVHNTPYVKQNFNDVETAGGRAALKIDLDESWTVLPEVIYQNQHQHGAFLYDPKVADLAVQDYTPEYGTDEWTQTMLTLNGKIGNWDMVYAGGYFDRTADLFQDYSDYTVAYDANVSPSYASFVGADGKNLDPTQRYHANDHYTKLSQEWRISSPQTGNPYKLTAGVFYERQTDRIQADYIIPGLAAIPSSPAVAGCGDDIYCTRVNRIDRDTAVFADGSYDLTKALTLTGGIRYFKSHNSLGGFSGGGSPAPFAKDVSQDGETHRVNATWHVDGDRLLYATYSTGFRPGGTNRRAGVNPYKADTLVNFEVGAKTQWFNHRLTVNVAAFRETWNNLQFALAPVGSLGVLNTYNAGNARIKGVEGDIGWRQGGLSLSASGSWIDAKLTSPFCAIGANGNPDCLNGPVAAPAGTPLPIQPKLKGSLTARYTATVGNARPFVQAVLAHQSGTRSALTDQDYSLLGATRGFESLDLSAGASYGAFSWSVYIQNLLDERGVISINTVCVPEICGAYARYYPTKPRLFGFKAGYRF